MDERDTDLHSVVIRRSGESSDPHLSDGIVQRDVNAVIWSMRLHGIRRYHGQRFWRNESVASDFSVKIEGSPRLETVAEHSWHVADIVLLLGGHFSDVNVGRALEMAVLHDKLEIVMGDQSPLGLDGTGLKAHAFNQNMRHQKDLTEREALNVYIAQLRPGLRAQQREVFDELMEGTSPASRFVKAVDKLQSFVYVLLKKRGEFSDRHLKFTLRYSAKTVEYFPKLSRHYTELRQRFLVQVARRRGVTTRQLEQLQGPVQLELKFET